MMLTRVNWKRVGLFIGLTFGLTWLLDLGVWLAGGITNTARTLAALQLQMLLPAFSAIVLQMFFFRDSPIYIGVFKAPARWFFYYFLFYTLAAAGAFCFMVFVPGQENSPFGSLVVQGLMLVGLALAVILRLTGGGAGFAAAGLAGGKVRYWLIGFLGFILLYGIQAGLNALFRLGEPADASLILLALASSGAAGAEQLAGLPPAVFITLMFAQSVVLSPLLALLISFGEEYGWRVYLQSELVKLGRARGVALLGAIWGLWHAPVILMGYNYPGYPVAGVALMTAYCVGLAFLLGYAVFKSGGVWLAAFLHGLNNQYLAFLLSFVYRPNDMVFSFGIGLYGLPILALAAGLLLLDPLWRRPAAAGASPT